MPYLGDLLMNEISNVAIIQWQNESMKIKDDRGQTYSQLIFEQYMLNLAVS